MSEQGAKTRAADLLSKWAPIVRKVQLGVGSDGLAELAKMIDELDPEDRPIPPITLNELEEVTRKATARLSVRIERWDEAICVVFTQPYGHGYPMIKISLHEKVGFRMEVLLSHKAPLPTAAAHTWYSTQALGVHMQDTLMPHLAETMLYTIVQLVKMGTGVDSLTFLDFLPDPPTVTGLATDKERANKSLDILCSIRKALLAAGVRPFNESFEVLPKKVEELAKLRDQKAELAESIRQQMVSECKGRDEKIERLEREKNTLFYAIGEARTPGGNTSPCTVDAAIEDLQELQYQRDTACSRYSMIEWLDKNCPDGWLVARHVDQFLALKSSPLVETAPGTLISTTNNSVPQPGSTQGSARLKLALSLGWTATIANKGSLVEAPSSLRIFESVQQPDPGLLDETEFTCPECKGHHYGSGKQPDGSLERLCNGYIQEVGGERRCNFKWNEKDDKLYMKQTGRKYPKIYPKINVGDTAPSTGPKVSPHGVLPPPRWTHDCHKCYFLGAHYIAFAGATTCRDLYVCPDNPSSPAVVTRWGNIDSENTIGKAGNKYGEEQDPFIREAWKRAAEQGLVHRGADGTWVKGPAPKVAPSRKRPRSLLEAANEVVRQFKTVDLPCIYELANQARRTHRDTMYPSGDRMIGGPPEPTPKMPALHDVNAVDCICDACKRRKQDPPADKPDEQTHVNCGTYQSGECAGGDCDGCDAWTSLDAACPTCSSTAPSPLPSLADALHGDEPVIERVAQAIYHTDGGMTDEDHVEAVGMARLPWDTIPEHERDEYRTMAHAAVTSILATPTQPIEGLDSAKVPAAINPFKSPKLGAAFPHEVELVLRRVKQWHQYGGAGETHQRLHDAAQALIDAPAHHDGAIFMTLEEAELIGSVRNHIKECPGSLVHQDMVEKLDALNKSKTSYLNVWVNHQGLFDLSEGKPGVNFRLRKEDGDTEVLLTWKDTKK